MSDVRVESQVLELAEPLAEQLSATVVAVEYRRESGGRVLRVILHHPDGVDLDLCQNFSHALSDRLDEADLISDPYMLEVASPGLNRQLKSEREIRIFSGRTVRLTLRQEIQGHRVLVGTLEGLSREGNVLLECDGEQLSLAREAIARLHLHEEFGKERGKRA